MSPLLAALVALGTPNLVAVVGAACGPNSPTWRLGEASDVPSTACVDDPDWRRRWVATADCAWVGELPASRCNDEDENGVEAEDACGCACGPTAAPSAEPVVYDCAWVASDAAARCGSVSEVKAEVACARACGAGGPADGADSETWYHKEPRKNCAWVGSDPAKAAKRCDKIGADPAAAACAFACDPACAEEDDGDALEAFGDDGALCEDDASWANKKSQDCAWVAAKPEQRCDRALADVSGEDACRSTCGDGGEEDSATWFLKKRSKDCAWVAAQTAKKRKRFCKKSGSDGFACAASCEPSCGDAGGGGGGGGGDAGTPGDGAWVMLGLDGTDSPAEVNDLNGDAQREWLGRRVALSRDGLVVAAGATEWNGNMGEMGKVKVWAWRTDPEDPGWDLRSETTGTGGDQWYGFEVALNGDGSYLAVATAQSTVFVYRWTGNRYQVRGEPIVSSGWFGFSLSLSDAGNLLAVGAPYAFEISSGRGAIYAYADGAWAQRGGDVILGGIATYAGHAISLSADGSTVAVGCGQPTWGNGPGKVGIYEYDAGGDEWLRVGAFIEGLSARSVALSGGGDVVIVGAHENEPERRRLQLSGSLYPGSARVYAWDGSSWAQRGGDIDGEEDQETSGYDVAISSSGDAVVVGAPGYDSRRGRARVYDWARSASGAWSWAARGSSILGENDAPDGYSIGDESGISVAMSADGSRIAVGAHGAHVNYGTDPISDKPEAGHVRVWAWAAD